MIKWKRYVTPEILKEIKKIKVFFYTFKHGNLLILNIEAINENNSFEDKNLIKILLLK